MPSEGTVAIPHYQRGTPRPIHNLQIDPMPERPGYWQGRFDLEQAEEAKVLEAWRHNRFRLGMPGLEGVTIQWMDFRSGKAFEYTVAALRYDGKGFIFEGAKLTP